MGTYRDLIRKILYFEELGTLKLDEEISEESLDKLRVGMLRFTPSDVPYNDDRQMNIDDYLNDKDRT
tara:strand:- start:2217 stop:2417 length:201 start_codon:yes stop_codon:yes gene_type:complete